MLKELTISLTNPKAALFWLALMSFMLAPGTPRWYPVAVIIGTTAIALALALYSATAVFFSTPRVMAGYARIKRAADSGLGLLFVGLGAALILSQQAR